MARTATEPPSALDQMKDNAAKTPLDAISKAIRKDASAFEKAGKELVAAARQAKITDDWDYAMENLERISRIARIIACLGRGSSARGRSTRRRARAGCAAGAASCAARPPGP